MTPRARPRVLFLTFVYPCRNGAGAQLRSAGILRMLAAHCDIYLLIAGYVEKVGGPVDPEIERLCRKIVYARIRLSEKSGVWPSLNTEAEAIDLPTIDCVPADVTERIIQFYQENSLDSLFAFRFEAVHFIYQRLDFFPVRHLDVDELSSRRQAQVVGLQGAFDPEANSLRNKTMRATVRLMEKTLLPKFHRVFVASAVEAEHVRRLTGFSRALVLPNAYPTPAAFTEKEATQRAEILFVGTLSYPPNIDAVLYFCREILPLIQEKKGDAVLFRVVGMGVTDALDCIRTQPGVEVVGYQEDIEPFYARAAFVVVPLRAGTGTRFKILEAFARGRSVVSTSVGAEGLEVTHRKNILLADDTVAFAQACLELIDNPELARRLCDEAARLHRDLYSEAALLRCYEQIMGSTP